MWSSSCALKSLCRHKCYIGAVSVADPDQAFGWGSQIGGRQKCCLNTKGLLKYQRLSAKIVLYPTKEAIFCWSISGCFCWWNYGIFQGITTV